MRTINNRSELKQYVRELIAKGEIDTKVYKWIASDKDSVLWLYKGSPLKYGGSNYWSSPANSDGKCTSFSIYLSMDWGDTSVELTMVNEDWYPKLEDLPSDCEVTNRLGCIYITSSKLNGLVNCNIMDMYFDDKTGIGKDTMGGIGYSNYNNDLTNKHIMGGDIIQISNPDGTTLWKRPTVESVTELTMSEIKTGLGITGAFKIKESK